MNPNSRIHKQLRDSRNDDLAAHSLQALGDNEVKAQGAAGNLSSGENLQSCHANKSSVCKHMRGIDAAPDASECNKLRALNYLRGDPSQKNAPQSIKRRECAVRPSTLMRWCKFNVVGGIGIVVQFVVLIFVKRILGFHYLAATAIAVEVAVLNNFLWHERFTWNDRLKPKRAGQRAIANHSMQRLLRFHLANGAVSLVGNLALMKIISGIAHINYLVANAIAIAICALVNFVMSEKWVFASES